MQHAPVHDAPRKRQHQFGVRNGPEVVREVGVYNFRVASEQRLFHLDHRLLGIAAQPVGILLRLQVGLEDRFEHQQRRRLYHAVLDRWDAQRPLPAVRLGYPYPTHGLRLIRLLTQLLRQFTQPTLPPIRLDVREALAIDADCAVIELTAL